MPNEVKSLPDGKIRWRGIKNGMKWCSACKEPKLSSEFRPRERGRVDLFAYCRPCERLKNRAKYTNNIERHRECGRIWREANRSAYRKMGIKHYIKKTYGLTVAEYEAKKISQNGVCAMCKQTTDKLVLDHCHSSNRNRDFLCNHCNTFIGHLEKNPDLYQNAVTYLEKYQGGMVSPCPTK